MLSSTLSFRLNNVKCNKNKYLLGKVHSVHHFTTHESYSNNAAIVVNKVLWYGIRLIYVHKDTDAITVEKICERKTHSEVEDVIDTITDGLQSLGRFKIDKKWKDPNIKIDVKLIVNSSAIKLHEFTLCRLKWMKEPLKNIAKLIGGQHSRIEAKFSYKSHGMTKYETIIVERQQNGIFLEKFGGQPKESHAEAYDYQLNCIDLEEFLILCNKHGMTEYKLHKNDCHAFAEAIWNECAPGIEVAKPNTKITGVGRLFNVIIPIESSGVHNKMPIDCVNPNDYDDATIFKNLGIII